MYEFLFKIYGNRQKKKTKQPPCFLLWELLIAKVTSMKRRMNERMQH